MIFNIKSLPNHHTIVSKFSHLFPRWKSQSINYRTCNWGTRLGRRFLRLPDRGTICVCHVACLKFQKGTTGLQIAPLFRLKSEVVFDNYAVGKETAKVSSAIPVWEFGYAGENITEILNDEFFLLNLLKEIKFSSTNVDNKMINIYCAYLKFKFKVKK